MSMPKHLDPEDVALYALQLLSPEEVAPISLHLEHNPAARQQLAEYQGDLAAFALSAEMHSPPALARTRFLNRIGREARATPHQASRPVPAAAAASAVAEEGAPAGSAVTSIGAYQRAASMPERDAASSGFARRVLPWAGWAIAAGLTVAVANLHHERESMRGSLATAQQQTAKVSSEAERAREVVDAITDQGAMRATLTKQNAPVTPQGRTTYSADKGVLIFVATNLEPLPSFKVYELWLIPADGGKPRSRRNLPPRRPAASPTSSRPT